MFKKILITFMVVVSLFGLCIQRDTLADLVQSLSYRIANSSFFSGSGAVSSSSYEMPVTALGQQLADTSTSTSYIMQSGLMPVLALGSTGASQTGTDQVVIDSIKVSNIKSKSVIVSWVSSLEEQGSVVFGSSELDQTAIDIRGAGFSGKVHFVKISGLSSDTIYEFKVISGEGEYSNDGANYQFITGENIAPHVESDVVYGQVFLNDGVTVADGTLVYIKVRDNDASGDINESALQSVLVPANGFWHYDLSNIRTDDFSARFQYSQLGDELVLEAIGPQGETLNVVANTSSDAPLNAVVLP